MTESTRTNVPVSTKTTAYGNRASGLRLSDELLVVGAPFEDTAAAGDWTSTSNENGTDTGAIYTFR